jgi:5-methylcytosine-specific restriction enzyme subunit McrC
MLLRLTEAGPAQSVALNAEQARRLTAANILDVRPGAVADSWTVRAARKVGAARVGDIEVRIEPKVPVARLLFLLGYARSAQDWRDEIVSVPAQVDLIPAVAAALWRQIERALRQGLLQGYQTFEETSPVLRGRLRETDQLGRRPGLPLPLEIRHDEYTVDIAENRILATAAERMLRVPGVDTESRRMLRHQANRMSEVTRLRSGERPPAWRPSRLNARYQIALRLAELVLAGSAVEAGIGRVMSNGFLVDMPRVFEDFLFVALRHHIEVRYGGAVASQVPGHLDQGRRIDLRPDILWRRGGRVAAVVDAKYKAYTPADDAYQMLAYCTVFGLRQGHLVYVTGERPADRHLVRNADIEIVCHGLDLSVPPSALLGQVAKIGDEIADSLAATGSI